MGKACLYWNPTDTATDSEESFQQTSDHKNILLSKFVDMVKPEKQKDYIYKFWNFANVWT